MTCWPLARFSRNLEPVVPAGLYEALGYGVSPPSSVIGGEEENEEIRGAKTCSSKIKFVWEETAHGIEAMAKAQACIFLPLRGGSRKMLKRLLINKPSNPIPLRVCWAILQGAKRGCATVGPSFVEDAFDKHHEALTKEQAALEPDVKEAFRKKFREIFRHQGCSKWYAGVRHTPYLQRHFDRVEGNPGPNACNERTRKEDGRAGEVRARWLDHLTKELDLKEGDLLGVHCDASTGKMYEEKFTRDLLPRIPHTWLVKEALKVLKSQDGICHATVVECLEPLKCRLITKGSALPYAAVMPFQKDMRKYLYDTHFAFKLIGEPLTEQWLHELLAKERKAGIFKKDIEEGRVIKWNSGDFSAATDGISQEINSLALEEYINSRIGITDDEKTIMRAVLGNHKISYPDRDKERGESAYKQREPFMQKNGQLMGCPLSFPILCSINLACYWLALEEYTGRRFNLKDLPVLINGDDILFRATDEFAEKWHKWITLGGFTLSQGKNYLAKDFLTVNSVCYSYRSAEELKARVVLAEKTLGSAEPPTPPDPNGITINADGREVLDNESIASEDQKEPEPIGKPSPRDEALKYGTNPSDRFTKIGYLNTGLLYQCGEMKDQGWEHGCRKELREKPFAEKLTDLLEGCHDKKRTWKSIKKNYAQEIFHATQANGKGGNISLTAHPALGGIGVSDEWIKDFIHYTPFQQKLAGFLKYRLKKGGFGHTEDINGDMMVDLTKNLGFEGRIPIRNDAVTLGKVPSNHCFGSVVMKRKDEPLRDGETRVRDLRNTNALFNYQAPFDEKKKNIKYTMGHLPKEALKEYRATKFPKVLKNPSCFFLEARCHSLWRTDSRFVWEVEVEKDGVKKTHIYLPGVHEELVDKQTVEEINVDHENPLPKQYIPFCTIGAGGINSKTQLVEVSNSIEDEPPIVEQEVIDAAPVEGAEGDVM